MSRIDKTLTAAVALAVLVPAIVTGFPGELFNMIAWPIMGDARILAGDPHARLLSDPRFDGYNNLWPTAVIVDLLLFQGAAGAHANIAAYLLNAATILGVYILAGRLGAPRPGLVALALATLPSWALIGAGLVRETLARPLIPLSIVALSTSPAAGLIMSIGLALTHHLSSLTVLLAITTLPVYAAYAEKLLGRSGGRPPTLSIVAASIVLAGVTIVLAGRVPQPPWGPWDPVDAAFYTASLGLIPLLALTLRGDGRLLLLSGLLASLAAGSLLALAVVVGAAPGIPRLGIESAGYLAPGVLAPAAVALGFNNTLRGEYREAPAGWALLFPVAGLGAYLALDAPMASTAAARTLNLAMLGAVLVASYSRWGARLLFLGALVGLVFAAAGGPGSLVVAPHYYSGAEVAGARWAAVHAGSVVVDSTLYYPVWYYGGDPRMTLGLESSGLAVWGPDQERYGSILYDYTVIPFGGPPRGASMVYSGGGVVGAWIPG